MSLPTISPAGKLLVTTTLPNPKTYANAMLYNAAQELYVSSAAPAGLNYANGFRFAADGALYVSESAPQIYAHGLGFRLDGALCVSQNPPAGYSQGLPISGSGGIAVSGLAAQPTFFAPLMTTLVPTTAGNPTFTFARATTAYVADNEGILRQSIANEARFQGARRVRNWLAETNLLTAAAGWSVANATISTGVSDPFGGNTAITITATGANGQWYRNILANPANEPCVASFWVRRRTGSTPFNFVAPTGGAGAVVPATATWQRVSIFAASVALAAGYCGIQGLASGDAIDVWGPQSEIVAGQSNQAPSEYVSVGVLAAPYHGNAVDGVKYFATTNGNSVAANVVTEAAGTAIPLATTLGYVAENAATNLARASQTFDDTGYWAQENVGIGANDAAASAPDGTITADRFTDNAVSGPHRIYGTFTAIVGTYTFSAYVKQGTMPWVQLQLFVGPALWANVNLATGAVGFVAAGTTVAVVALPNGWFRISVSGTAAATPSNFQICGINANTNAPNPSYVGTGQTMYLWGAQVEQASDPSSYVPTTTVAVTRNADALAFQTATNVDGTLATAYSEVYFPNAAVGFQQFPFEGLPTGYAYHYYESTKFLGIYSGAGPAAMTANQRVVGAINKAASAWSGVTASTCLNGGTVATGAFVAYSLTSFRVGGGVQPLRAIIRNVKFYATRLTDAELQALTT